MFGFGGILGSRSRGAGRGAFTGSNLRNAMLAGAGMLALRWWRNRRGTHGGRRPGGTGGASNTGAGSGFSAGGNPPGGTTF